MALDTLEVFGVEYQNVAGIKATDDNGNTKTYIRPQGTKSISANGTGIDVTEYAAVDVAVPAPSPSLQNKTVSPTTSQQTIQADGGYDGLDTVTVNAMPSGSASTPATSITANPSISVSSGGLITATASASQSVTPTVSAGYVSSGTRGTVTVSGSNTEQLTTLAAATIHPSTSDQTITTGKFITGRQTIKAVTTTNLTADNIKNGVTVKIGDSTDDDCVTTVTGTYAGGTSKNVQVVQGTTRTTSSSMTAIGAEMTVSKTGTYDVYWSAFRSNTSSQYTFATQLYVGGSAYGSESTTWSNHIQNVHLSNVSLTINQKIRVYGRESRGSSYYMYAGTLTIVEA